MVKFIALSILSALVANASAFVTPNKVASKNTALASSTTEIWDPLGLYELGSGKAFDTFPNVFPEKQYLQASEVKHGRQAMLAWTGVWATTEVSSRVFFGLW
jgi:Chlorophyll A-B binding protein